MKTWTELGWWGVAGSKEISQDELIHSKVFKASGGNYQPPWQWVYRAFNMVPFDKVRIVIIGQDPFPTAGHATGLAFSVPNGTTPLPPTLKNIFAELESDLGIKVEPGIGDLTPWASRGVMLLNTALTVEVDKVNSHADIGWRALTIKALRALIEHRTGIVFVMWGKFALDAFNAAVIEIQPGVWKQNGHYRVISSHPSPLSADLGFKGSKPFSTINGYLGDSPIDWSL
jgi:uracil-DNA glycosylase